MKLKYLIFILLLFVNPAPFVGQNTVTDNYNISVIGMDDGLMHDYIDDIYKDSKGFVWFSTRSGLSRYDGYTFTNYNMNSTPVSLKGNFVHKVCGDFFGRLWIASEGGLDILDLNSSRLSNLFDGEQYNKSAFLKQPITNIINDSRGNIWVFAVNALYKIEFNPNGNIREIYSLTLRSHSLRSVVMSDIDYDGKIWIGVDEKILKAEVDSGNNNLKINEISEKLIFDRNTSINSMLLKDNEVWIGTDFGLFRYYKRDNIIKHYIHDNLNMTSLSQNHISDLCVTDSKQILIATLNGINVYNSDSDSFTRILKEDHSSSTTLSSNFINCLLSAGDDVWVGTATGGVNLLSPKSTYVINYSNVQGDTFSLSDNPVNAILEDEDETIWVGTVEGGLNRKKKNEDVFTHYTQSSTTRLSHNSVSALCVDNKERLWVGTWGNGVSIIDRLRPEQPAIKYINLATHPDHVVSFVSGLYYDKINNGMWIGTSQGLYFYDLERDLLSMPFKNKMPVSISSFMSPVVDQDDNLWFGTTEGLFIIDLHAMRDGLFPYIHINHKLDNKQSHLVDYITSLYLDSEGTLWLGSDGFGLYKRVVEEKGTYSFQSYTTSHGLVSNHVKGILEDDDGNLWISTNKGLSCYNKSNNIFLNYFKENGLDNDHFYWNSFSKSKDGILYFGTLEGMIGIDPKIFLSQDYDVYKVAFTDLKVNNQTVYPGKYIDKDISMAEKLFLHENDKSFSISFSALHYNVLNNYVYSYKLEGFDDDWMQLKQGEHVVSYMNLPSGNYTFKVKYTPKDQMDLGEVTQLGIRVKPYFYKTTLFITFVILLIFSLSIFWYFMRMKAFEARQLDLQDKVDRRTHELELQKGILSNQKNELYAQNQRLSEQNDKITTQKDQLVEMSQKLQKMTVDRLDFFTNITHEFRTPITLIIGPVERALKLSTNPYVIEQLSFAERNSKYLLSLVNQLMDFRKIESSKLEISYRKGDISAFLDSVLSSFEFQLSDRKITLRKLFKLNNPEVYFDEDSIRKVMTNLLSNAIKYTPNEGEITIYLRSIKDVKTDDNLIYISVRDSGAGIPESDTEKVFERYYQSKNGLRFPMQGQSSTGIGLYLTKQIILMLSGQISVKNNRTEGTTFRVVLPLHESDPNLSKPITNTVTAGMMPDEQTIEISKEWNKDKLTFLVVEDNRDMNSYICSVLSPYYNTVTASNGTEALEVLEQYNIDFIISDLMMPVMDGLELSKRVKENFSLSHIPFIMLTAKTSQQSKTDSYRMGVDSYIIKPFDEDILLARIQNILNSRSRYQQNFNEHMTTESLEISEESNDKKFMDSVLDVMNDNYHNPYFEVGDFVDALGVSKSLLNKKLNALSGKSAGQFIRTYRLNLAYKLILQNKVTKNKNISDIAYEVGFNDPKYFSRCFSRHFKITPSKLMED